MPADRRHVAQHARRRKEPDRLRLGQDREGFKQPGEAVHQSAVQDTGHVQTLIRQRDPTGGHPNVRRGHDRQGLLQRRLRRAADGGRRTEDLPRRRGQHRDEALCRRRQAGHLHESHPVQRLDLVEYETVNSFRAICPSVK